MMKPCNRIYYSTVHWKLNMFRAAHRSSSRALTVFAASGLHTRVVTGRSQVWVGTELHLVGYFSWVNIVTHQGGPGSSVGIVTGYGLDSLRIKSRWGARFSAPVQTGPGAHPASCIMGTGSFPGVKSGRGVTLTTHPLLVPLVMKE
jgi:hypothetical protein